MKTKLQAALVALAAASSIACAQVPAGYPESYRDLIAAAKKEGKVIVYSVTSAVPALLDDFQALYPDVKLEYVALDTGPLYDRVISESVAGATGDVIWSSAMDLQVKLVNDGYAMKYASPETSKLPSWAVWRDEAYGSTFEPVGFVYNKGLVDKSDVPRTHAEFIELLKTKPDKFKGKITAFDPAKSGLGYLLMTQDLIVSPARFWELAKALGTSGLYPGTGTGAQFERIAKGESLMGYNLLVSYAMGRIKKDLPQLDVALPQDHTLVISRVMFISRSAAHPSAARLWVDYVLSKRGQEMLARSDLGSLRADVDSEMTPSALATRLGGAVKPVPVGPDLLTYLAAEKRTEFLAEWNRLVTGSSR